MPKTKKKAAPEKPTCQRGSDLYYYGDKDFFQQMLDGGFTQIAVTNMGPWIGDRRIVRMYVCYHPTGVIKTFETHKEHDGSHTHRGTMQNTFPGKQEFEKYLTTHKLKVGKPADRETLRFLIAALGNIVN